MGLGVDKSLGKLEIILTYRWIKRIENDYVDASRGMEETRR